MRRVLVVANQTLAESELLSNVYGCVAWASCRVHLVVPATPPQDQLTYTEGEAEEIARRR